MLHFREGNLCSRSGLGVQDFRFRVRRTVGWGFICLCLSTRWYFGIRLGVAGKWFGCRLKKGFQLKTKRFPGFFWILCLILSYRASQKAVVVDRGRLPYARHAAAEAPWADMSTT